MNKVILMGRLTHDPEMRQTPNGTMVADFSIAVNRRFAKEGQQDVDFINCIAWRNTADFLCKYFRKGSMIALCGSLQVNSWKDNDGKKHYKTDVVVDEVYFTGEKRDSEAQKSTGIEGMGFRAFDAGDDDLPF